MLTAALLAIAIPEVVLSEEHQAQSKVVVGQQFPIIEGTNAEGQGATVADVAAGQIAVVVTPGEPAWMNSMLKNDLSKDFVAAYSEKSIRFIGLGSEIEVERVAVLKVGAERVADALGVCATPRVYVIDKDGKIIWFDLEYTLSTHRELHEVLDELTAE